MYSELPHGVVFEVNAEKAEALARQRPSWTVYEADATLTLAAGAGAHLACNLIDIDPYGEPWPTLEAYFSSTRPFPPQLAIAVNDGMRTKLRLGGGYEIKSLLPAVREFGNSVMYVEYIRVARWNLTRLAAEAGYGLTDWTGYYCGRNGAMTHYAAVLERAA